MLVVLYRYRMQCVVNVKNVSKGIHLISEDVLSQTYCEQFIVSAFYSRPRIASAIAEDCYILVVFLLFYFFFRPPNFRCPWADFHENLPHDAVCPEIVYLL